MKTLDVITIGRSSVDLYGQQVEVTLIDYLRPEAKFDSLDALKVQMDADAAKARALLSA